MCGFHVTFIGLHLPSYISDKAVGMSFFGTPVSALELGGWAIGLVGLFNIAGSLIWGWLGSQYPKKDMLALLYALRALAFVMFLALPLSWVSVLLFSASLGFLWLGTIPLTSGLVGYMFGSTHMSMLWGIVFFSHQLGSFLGGWGAGRLYDIQGNYDLMWWISVGLGVFAAVIHWWIRERPVPRSGDGGSAGMSIVATRDRQINLAPNRRRQHTPYWLLWSTGIVAFVLCIVAFVLWGINGASTLFDMIVALCG